LTRQTAFAEKISHSQEGDYGFFSLPGNDGELDLTFVDVEDGICRITLGENYFALFQICCCPLAGFCQKGLQVESRLVFFNRFHGVPSTATLCGLPCRPAHRMPYGSVA